MSLTDEIKQDKEELERHSDIYLKAIVDFVKWTSTITIGAILWIGDNLEKLVGYSLHIAILALTCMFISVAIAIIVARRVIIASAKEWEYAIADSNHKQSTVINLVIRNLIPNEKQNANLKQHEREQDRSKWEKLQNTKPFSHPGGYNRWLTTYLVFLMVGLLLYLTAQIINALQ